MRRRDFIMLLGSAAAALPVAAHDEQADRVRRIGVLMAHAESDPEYKSYLTAFRQELAERGWREERNIKIQPVTSGRNASLIPRYGNDLRRNC